MAGMVRGLQPGGRWPPPSVRPAFVAVDVDGTLLGDGRVSPRVVDALAACRAAGLGVGLATGRAWMAVADLIDHLGLDGPHVVHDGAEVRADGRVLRTVPLPRSALDAALRRFAMTGRYAEVYLPDRYLVTRHDRRAARHWELIGAEPAGLARPEAIDGDPVLKITALCFDGDRPEQVADELAADGAVTGIAHAPALPDATFVNVTAPGVDKASGLAAALDGRGVDVARVAVVGDGGNDVPLLRRAGLAVAMGQSGPEVRAAAHLVAPDLHADGAAVALEAIADLARA